jgi:hypothetical protein
MQSLRAGGEYGFNAGSLTALNIEEAATADRGVAGVVVFAPDSRAPSRCACE